MDLALDCRCTEEACSEKVSTEKEGNQAGEPCLRVDYDDLTQGKPSSGQERLPNRPEADEDSRRHLTFRHERETVG